MKIYIFMMRLGCLKESQLCTFKLISFLVESMFPACFGMLACNYVMYLCKNSITDDSYSDSNQTKREAHMCENFQRFFVRLRNEYKNSDSILVTEECHTSYTWINANL